MSQPAAQPPVLVEQRGNVQVITLNRPEARNAVNRAVSDGIEAALDDLDARDDLSVGVLTGAGATFCSGMDLKAFLGGEDPMAARRGFGGITLVPSRKPLVAAVEGWALAGGCEIALACDLIVAAENARFGIPEVKRGLVAAAGGLLRLPHRLPPAIAMELAITGEPISAADALRFGLVNRVVPAGAALESALELAAAVAANGPLAVTVTKQIVTGAADWTLAEGWERQGELVSAIMRSEDAREGALAFAEKRAPAWTGR